jgi:hypothetical protein
MLARIPAELVLSDCNKFKKLVAPTRLRCIFNNGDFFISLIISLKHPKYNRFITTFDSINLCVAIR